MIVEVSYSKAGYRSRLFAFFFDAMCVTFLSLLLVFVTQKIMNNVSYYKDANEKINEIQLASHLYKERDDGTLKLKCDHYKINNDDYEETIEILDESLIEFYSDPLFFDQSDPKSGLYLYKTQKIPEGENSSELFVYEDENHTNIVPRASVSDEKIYDWLCKAMSEDAVKYVIDNPDYISNSRTISLTHIFIILTIPIAFSISVFEYVVPLFFYRGRKTFGKLIFKIAVVDNRGLSCPLGRFTLRFLFFLFLEVALSVVAFAIPFIISFSMFVFSKVGQSLHDYVMNTYVIEAPSTSVMISEEEYIEKMKKSKEYVLNKEDVAL